MDYPVLGIGYSTNYRVYFCVILGYKFLLVLSLTMRPLVTYAWVVCASCIGGARNWINCQLIPNEIVGISTHLFWLVRSQHIHNKLGIDNISEYLRWIIITFLNIYKTSPVRYAFILESQLKTEDRKQNYPGRLAFKLRLVSFNLGEEHHVRRANPFLS